ncbi:acetyl-CoA carboxylase biotin carboxyl carrier protein [Lactiplantibacillus plajomi]|uniref:Biotin carboxyl carrier protein of acetyl-CoA carboxylase n=1 Tax=Lactiplantibacillus plajomi TaxID=1457217 RepID=A0ABV6K5A5_9LACO|nr:biotin/lipoyl-containing protein [Lactiplantibacillus plajomi]
MAEKELNAMTTLIKTFNTSSAQVLNVKTPAYELHLNKQAERYPAVDSEAAPLAMTGAPEAPAASAAPTVTAPLVGVAYLAPEPGKPPFVQVGDHVDKGQTVCVIEAMKLINEVPSPISGTIKRILVEDGRMVEFSEPLIELEADRVDDER